MGGSTSAGRSENRSEIKRPLIRPQELLQDCRKDEAFVISAGNPPLRCGRAIYFRRRDWDGLVGRKMSPISERLDVGHRRAVARPPVSSLAIVAAREARTAASADLAASLSASGGGCQVVVCAAEESGLLVCRSRCPPQRAAGQAGGSPTVST
jgi:type IV secretory pathway TraG/TraD family ATPase VirD4